MPKNNLALVVKDLVPDPKLLVKRVVETCDELKGRETVVLEVGDISSYADFIVVVSGHSDRHVQGIANRAMFELEKLGVHPISIEGLEDGHWVVVDYGDIVLHVFYEPKREFYDIESLWFRAKRLNLLPKNLKVA